MLFFLINYRHRNPLRTKIHEIVGDSDYKYIARLKLLDKDVLDSNPKTNVCNTTFNSELVKHSQNTLINKTIM